MYYTHSICYALDNFMVKFQLQVFEERICLSLSSYLNYHLISLGDLQGNRCKHSLYVFQFFRQKLRKLLPHYPEITF